MNKHRESSTGHSTKDKKSTKHTVHEQKETGRSRKALEWRSAPTDKEKGFEIIKSFWKWSQYRTRSAPVPQLQKLWWKMILVDLDFKGHFSTDHSSENPPPLFLHLHEFDLTPDLLGRSWSCRSESRHSVFFCETWQVSSHIRTSGSGRVLLGGFCVFTDISREKHWNRHTVISTGPHSWSWRRVLMFTCSRLLLCWSRICRRGRSGCWSREASGRGSACVWPGNENE